MQPDMVVGLKNEVVKLLLVLLLYAAAAVARFCLRAILKTEICSFLFESNSEKENLLSISLVSAVVGG